MSLIAQETLIENSTSTKANGDGDQDAKDKLTETVNQNRF